MARRRTTCGVAALIAAALLALTGCGSDSGAGSASAGAATEPLEGSWTLARYAPSGAQTALPPGLSVAATFADGRAVVTGPVNTHRGPYTADPASGSLTIGPLASTQIGAPADQLDAESAVLAALESAASYAIDDDTLTIRDAEKVDVLVLSRDTRTVAGAWKVTGFNNGKEAVVSLEPGSTITAEFADDGTLTGDSGVNRYRTTYEVSTRGGVTIAPPAGTRRAGEPALMEQERLYLAALESAATYTLQGDALTLRDASDAIAVTLTRP